MKHLKKALFLFLLPLLAFTVAHKFYISVTNVGYSEKDDALQIITRVFLDDMNAVLKERYGIQPKLGTKSESEMDREYFEKYLRSKFIVEIDGKTVPYTLLGKKYDTDMIICYLEVPKIDLPKVSTIAITNEMLMDMFDEQQNVVHFKIEGEKKSYVLIKSDTKGMLNL
ncbi:DUF6702 family protein [Maribacter cobaltidurans]|uniref:Uncharacterized protein n=1 Tax=Maribacter cobaltidurans TaxID=1178778 RepID=A0A223V8A6_9FLAO|nr:DUF6702 family protein [Maribacter cobaltidurans]ASV31218.1 hypothetical protein CJ263_13895 [Maribacter cobaltidurans]GGD84112.1 hypothetical protein GCM10011412_22370 [Maribacter cobaltidurans]